MVRTLWGVARMSERGRRWYGSRAIEEALREAEPAAEYLKAHPPGTPLPAALEPGYVPEDFPCAACSSAAGEEVWHGGDFCPRWKDDE
jgi:hypothetical protein